MAAGCKKCDPHELCEECPEWIFTLADLIMCMMGLFVLLWVLKPGPTAAPAAGQDEQLIKVLAAVRDYFLRYPYTCLEQRTSKAIGLSDERLWQAVSGSVVNSSFG